MNVQLHWGVKVSMEAQLEKMIAANQGDFTSRTKLKLLRICQNICQSSSVSESLLYILGEMPIDDTLRQILGRDRSRISLWDFTCPASSPVVKAQETYVRLLSDWSPESSTFKLLQLTGGDMTSVELMMKARAHFLKLDVGVFDHFTLRLGGPPYSLLSMYFGDSVTREFVDRKLGHFYSMPLQCFALMCRQLRSRFPNKNTIKEEARDDLLFWSNTTDLAMDFSERSHGQMRTDLRSDVRARSVFDSASRMICHQIQSEHVSRNGDPVGASCVKVSDLMALGEKSSMLDMIDFHGDDTGIQTEYGCVVQDASNNRHGGSEFIRFRSSKLKAFKAICSPLQPLSKEEIQKFEYRVLKEWKQTIMDPDEHEKVKMLNQAVSHQSGSAAVSKSVTKSKPFNAVWGSSKDRKFMLDPAGLAEFISSYKGCQKDISASLDENVRVGKPVPSRAAIVKDMPISLVQGCYGNKKNICRVHGMTSEQHQALDRLAAQLSKWAESLDREARDSCAGLLWLHCAAGKDVIVCLQDLRLRPKMQYYLRCFLEGRPNELHYHLPPMPFTAIGQVSPSRLGDKNKALHTQTSDELCMELLALSSQWELFPLEWKFPEGARSLLHHEVLSVVEDTSTGEFSSSCLRPSRIEMSLMSMGDPFESGRNIAQGDISCGEEPGRSSSVREIACELPVWEVEDEAIDFDGELLHDIPLDVCDDLEAEMVRAMHLGDVGADHVVPQPEGEDEQRTPAFFASKSTIDINGRVICQVEPFSSKGIMGIGRITTWPEDKPLAERSISCLCLLHGGCRSPARKVGKVSQEQLLQWLYTDTAHLQWPMSKQKLDELRKSHQKAFTAILSLS
jgi:hypothetical protein